MSARFSGSYAVCCCCCSVQIEHSLYTWLPFFPLWFINFFSFILLLFYKRFYVFLAIAICIYLCFSEKSYFSFVLLVSSVIRPEYQTQQASCIKGKK